MDDLIIKQATLEEKLPLLKIEKKRMVSSRNFKVYFLNIKYSKNVKIFYYNKNYN